MARVTCPATGGGTETWDTDTGQYERRDDGGVLLGSRPLTPAEVQWVGTYVRQEADQARRVALRHSMRDFKNLPTPDHSAWTNADRRDLWRAVTDLCRAALDEQ